MKQFLILVFILICELTFSQLYQVDKSSVKFISDAPLELIQAESNKLTGLLNIDDRAFAFSLPMRSMQGFNSKLQQTHFNENYIETDKFPNAVFEGKIIEELDFTKPGKYKVRGKGKFSVHGAKQERIIRCTIEVKANQINIRSSFSVLLADHDIKIPSVVAQKITEEVEVQLNCVLVKR